MADITIEGQVGGFFGVTAEEIDQQIKEIDPQEKLNVLINSPGGSIFQGVKIHNLIKAHPGQTTTTVTGLAASIASYILMAGDTRKAFDNATVMIHNASVSFIEGGDHTFLRKLANTLESLSGLLSNAYARVTGKSKTKIQALMDDETWVFGEDIKSEGFVNEIISTDENEPKNKNEIIALNKLEFQNCVDKMQQEKNNDAEKLVAYFNSNQPAKPPVKPQPKKENMTLEEFLAFLGLNPEAKAMHETLIAEAKAETPEGAEKPVDLENIKLIDILALTPNAKTEHEQLIVTVAAEAKTELDKDKLSEADARYIASIIGAEAYQGNKAVVDTGIDTFAGKNDMKNFKTVVAMADQNAEMIKSLKIKNGQPGATGAEEHDLEGNTSVKSPKIQAKVADLKKQLNV